MAKPKKILKTRISNLYDTDTNWLTVETSAILEKGEIAVYAADDTGYPRFKIGDGSKNLSQLPFANHFESATKRDNWSNEDNQRTKICKVTYNNVSYDIEVPKVGYETTQSTATSIIGSLKVGDSSYDVKETPVSCTSTTTTGLEIGSVTVGPNTTTFKAPKVVSKTTDLVTVDNSNSSKEVEITILKNAFIDMMYPVGSIYLSVNSTNPGDADGVFKHGTWVPWGEGRVPVGVGTGTDENGELRTFEENDQGGEYKHKLLLDEMPKHNHNASTTYKNTAINTANYNDYTGSTQLSPSGTTEYTKETMYGELRVRGCQSGTIFNVKHSDPASFINWVSQSSTGEPDDIWNNWLETDGKEHKVSLISFNVHEHTHKFTCNEESHRHTMNHKHTIDTTKLEHTHEDKGSDYYHNNVQPYITCYMWKRIPDKK